MDWVQIAGMILTIWVVMRNIGNERECQLRMIEIRLREEAIRAAEVEAMAPPRPNPDQQPARPDRG